MARTWRAFAVVLLGLLAALTIVAGAPPATAHAGLVSSDPEMGALLSDAPDVVTLTFGEPVSVESAPRLFDHLGHELEVTAIAEGRRLVVDLPGLGDGTHVLAYSVRSSDEHPVAGSLEFSVGFVSPVAESATVTDGSGDGDDDTLDVGLVRGASYAGALVLVGLVLVHGVGPMAALVRRLTVGAAVVAGLGALPAHGLLAVVLLLVGGALSLVRVRWLAVLGTLVVLAAFVAEGHSRSSLVVAVSDVGHLLAGAVWLGGLAGCVVALRRLEPAEAGRVLTRFSVLAGGATALVAVSGTVMGARVLGSWEALTGTAYGRLLLLKASAVLVVVALAAVNRFRLLPALTTTATPRAAELLRRTVRAEAAVLLLALGVTGVLVQASPEPAAAAPGGTSTSRDGITVRVSVSPATVGPNEVTVEVSGPDGPVDVAAPPAGRAVRRRARARAGRRDPDRHRRLPRHPGRPRRRGLGGAAGRRGRAR
jgi:copper transport protein